MYSGDELYGDDITSGVFEEDSEPLDCLDEHKGDCQGEIEYHSVPGGNAFPRCKHHREERMDRFDNSIEREALSPLPPSWFDPANAGEHWDDDY